MLHILEFQERRLYADLGFSSMFHYLTKKMGYSESGAYRRIQSARLLKRVPGLSMRLKEGRLNLSQATELQKCLKEEEKKLNSAGAAEVALSLQEKAQCIIEKLETLNSFETKKVLAREFDRPVQTQEKAIPQKDNSVRLEVTFSQAEFAALEMAKNLMSHIAHEGSWAEVIAGLAAKYNQSKLGKASAKPKEPATDLTQSFAAAVKIKQKSLRKSIALKIRRKILQQADHCCEYQAKGRICGSRYQLQIDHRIPLSLGGSNSAENLRYLCRTHNLLAAKEAGVISSDFGLLK